MAQIIKRDGLFTGRGRIGSDKVSGLYAGQCHNDGARNPYEPILHGAMRGRERGNYGARDGMTERAEESDVEEEFCGFQYPLSVGTTSRKNTACLLTYKIIVIKMLVIKILTQNTYIHIRTSQHFPSGISS